MNNKINNKNKVAIISNTSWNIVNFRLNLINKLILAGYDVTVIAPKDNYTQEIEKRNLKYIPLKNLSRKGKNPFSDFLLIIELYNIFKSENIKMALTYTIKPNIYTSIASRFSRVEVICTVTGLGYSFLKNGIINTVTKILYKYAFKSSSCIVFQNIDDQLEFLNSTLIRDTTRTFLIKGSGVDSKYFSPIPNNNSNVVNFLFIGRLLKDKGIIEYIEAAKFVYSKHKDVKFNILGSLDYDNPAGVSSLDLNKWIKFPFINYLGNTNDIRSYLSNASVVVLPSYREGLPKTLLEALCMEKPIVTTDVPGCRDTVDDGVNGYLVKVKDVQSLAYSMLKMIEIGEKSRNEMGKKGREKALNEFDEEIIVRQYLDLLKICTYSR